MWRRLRPRELSFFSDFECQAHYARRAATLLRALVEDFADVPGAAKAIKDVEHAGDDVAHAVIARLHVTWVTPIDRHDIHTLAIRLDDVLDYLDAAASAFRVYRVKQPTPECRALMTEVVDCVAAMHEAVKCLRHLDAAFVRHAEAVHRHEHHAPIHS